MQCNPFLHAQSAAASITITRCCDLSLHDCISISIYLHGPNLPPSHMQRRLEYGLRTAWCYQVHETRRGMKMERPFTIYMKIESRGRIFSAIGFCQKHCFWQNQIAKKNLHVCHRFLPSTQSIHHKGSPFMMYWLNTRDLCAVGRYCRTATTAIAKGTATAFNELNIYHRKHILGITLLFQIHNSIRYAIIFNNLYYYYDISNRLKSRWSSPRTMSYIYLW